MLHKLHLILTYFVLTAAQLLVELFNCPENGGFVTLLPLACFLLMRDTTSTMVPNPIVEHMLCKIMMLLQWRGGLSLQCSSFTVNGILLSNRAANEMKLTSGPPFLVCQTCSNPIGSRRLLLTSSTQCLLWLWF